MVTEICQVEKIQGQFDHDLISQGHAKMACNTQCHNLSKFSITSLYLKWL